MRFVVRTGALRATLLLAYVVVAAVLPSRLDAQQGAGSIRGEVRDARTGEPLAAVRVRVLGRASETGPDGRFTLPTLPETATVEFERLGYRSIRLTAAEVGPVVELVPAPVLLGAVIAEAPRPNTLAAGTALTVGSVSSEAMVAGAHTSVAEAMAGAEGVSIARVGAWGPKPVLRGLGGDRIAVLIDGMRVNQACAFGMDQGVSAIDPAMVERVEILAGPGSTIYGSGNIGGVINVVTKKPGQHAPTTGELRAGASTGDLPGGTLGASFGVNRGPFDLGLSLDASKYGDYRTPEGVVDGSSFRHGTGDVRLGWTPDPAHRIAFQAQVYEGREIGWPAMRGATIPVEKRRAFGLDYGTQLGRGILDGLAARAYVQRLDHHMLVEMTMDGGMRSVTEQHSHSTTSGGRIQLRLLPSAASHLDVGIEATEWAAENSRWVQRSGPMGDIPSHEFRTWPGVSIVDVGIFGQGELRIVEGVTASAGGRVDWVARSAEGWESTKEWVGSGNVGLRWEIARGFGARAGVGYGYRIANATELFGIALKPDGFAYLGNPELETETNRNVEASLTYDGARLSASVTAYRNDLSGLISPVLLTGDSLAGHPVRSYANLDDARLTGVTGSFQWQALARLGLSGTVGHTRGEDRATGRALAAVPPVEGTLTARFTAGEGSWLEIEGHAAGRQDRAAAHVGEVETAGYAVVNARAGFGLAGVDVVAGVDNILDRAYRGHLDPVHLLRPGRSLYVKLSRRW